MASWQNDNISEVVGQYANDKGYKNVVLMTANFQGGKDVLGGFKRFYKGKILDEIYTPLNQLDFSTELTQIAATKPDAVFAFYPGSMAITFVRQYQLAGLLKRIQDGTISNKIAKEVFDGIWAGEGDADAIIESKGLKQVSDSGAIEKIVDEVLAANAAMVAEYKAGKEKAFNGLVGQCMKASKGKANPAQVNEILKQKLA